RRRARGGAGRLQRVEPLRGDRNAPRRGPHIRRRARRGELAQARGRAPRALGRRPAAAGGRRLRAHARRPREGAGSAAAHGRRGAQARVRVRLRRRSRSRQAPDDGRERLAPRRRGDRDLRQSEERAAARHHRPGPRRDFRARRGDRGSPGGDLLGGEPCAARRRGAARRQGARDLPGDRGRAPSLRRPRGRRRGARRARGRRAMNGGENVSQAAMMGLGEAARGAGGVAHGDAHFSGITTDSRAVNAGDLFVALVGERFDGHEYVAEAVRRGAVAALVSRRIDSQPAIPQIVVEDTRLGLGRLAGSWRGRFALPLVALTGSNGKTTVKEMIASILAAHCGTREAVLATEGNLNNDIGMPLTLLKLRERHRYAVIEMGMNHAGEIDYLTRLARPGVALVNNAQRAHVGLLGSLEAVAHAKGEIYSGLSQAGIAVVNADDAHAAYWKSVNAGRRIVTFGISGGADVSAARSNGGHRFTTPAGAFSVALQ